MSRIPAGACEKVVSDLGLGGGRVFQSLHHLQLASHELAVKWQRNHDNQNSNKNPAQIRARREACEKVASDMGKIYFTT